MGKRKLSAFCLSVHFVTTFGSSKGQAICLQRITSGSDTELKVFPSVMMTGKAVPLSFFTSHSLCK